MLISYLNCSDIIQERNTTRNVSTNSTSSNQLRIANLIFDIYNFTTLVLSFCNVILNIFAQIVFRHRSWRNSPMSMIFRCFTIVEVIFNAAVFTKSLLDRLSTLSIIPQSNLPSLASAILQIESQLFLSFTMSVLLICRNWNIILLAAHRYESICLPIGSKKYIRKQTIYKMELLILILAVCITVPRLFEVNYKLCYNDMSWNIMRASSGMLRSQVYRYLHRGAILFLFQSGGPIIIICILSFYVLRVIWKMKEFRNRQYSQPSTNGKKKMSQPVGDRLILMVCVIFFVLESPSFFSKILDNYLRRHDMKEIDQILLLVANTCIYLDSFINFSIYVLSNSNFRSISLQILRECYIWKCSSRTNLRQATEMTTA